MIEHTDFRKKELAISVHDGYKVYNKLINITCSKSVAYSKLIIISGTFKNGYLFQFLFFQQILQLKDYISKFVKLRNL